jgi:NADPH:quinone reductase-like Zn-dependent oxidoreductase
MHAAILNPEGLRRVAGLLADGTVKVPIQRTYDVAQGAEALGDLGSGHTQGKLAIRVQS